MDNPIYLGKNEKIMITGRVYKKKIYVDIRRSFKKDTKIYPTKKGICISLDDFLEIYHSYDRIKKITDSLEKDIVNDKN